jgi:hypothetical protein
LRGSFIFYFTLASRTSNKAATMAAAAVLPPNPALPNVGAAWYGRAAASVDTVEARRALGYLAAYNNIRTESTQKKAKDDMARLAHRQAAQSTKSRFRRSRNWFSSSPIRMKAAAALKRKNAEGAERRRPVASPHAESDFVELTSTGT